MKDIAMFSSINLSHIIARDKNKCLRIPTVTRCKLAILKHYVLCFPQHI